MARMTDAYAAGLIDGEGCIGIAHSNGVFSARVDVGMTSKARGLLDALRREYGGMIRNSRPGTAQWDAAECWTLHGSAAAPFLERVAPHLQLKAEQARIALLVQRIVSELPKTRMGRSRWTPAARERCATLKLRIHELNRKGPTTPSTETRPPFARLVAGNWVTDQGDLFSDLGLAPFSGPWPKSGSFHGGCAYGPPTSAQPTAASASSSSRSRKAPTPETSSEFPPLELPEGAQEMALF